MPGIAWNRGISTISHHPNHDVGDPHDIGACSSLIIYNSTISACEKSNRWQFAVLPLGSQHSGAWQLKILKHLMPELMSLSAGEL
jgi:hypothetical protein